MERVRVEVCATSVEEAMAAQAAGADSVELCSDLASGGVTPGMGLVEEVLRAVRLPVRVLVRPRAGNFQFNEQDRSAVVADVRWLARMTASPSIVTGALDAEGLPDAELLRAVRMILPAAEITFHRAIDHAPDPLQVLDTCRSLGVRRILTSGGAARALDGLAVIAALVARAGTNLRIAAAGGIGPANVVRIVEGTGVGEVHFAAQRAVPSRSAGRPSLNSARDTEAFDLLPDVGKIEGVLEALDKAGLR